MTTILSWNIQYAIGGDGRSDVERIARIAAAGNHDVLCFQEVTQNWPELDVGRGVDQVAAFGALFPGYAAYYGVSVEWRRPDGRVSRFGNLILSRLAMRSGETHLLPRPPFGGVKHMRRSLAEIVVESPFGGLRVATTHLEFSSDAHRLAQIERIRAIHQETYGHHVAPPYPGPAGKPFASPLAPKSVVLCGDLNCPPDNSAHRRLTERFVDDAPGLVDAWPIANGDGARPSTCNVHSNPSASEPSDVRDYFFVSEDIAPRITRMAIDLDCDASDHQPLWLELSDRADR